jgi:hypothetical protein
VASIRGTSWLLPGPRLGALARAGTPWIGLAALALATGVVLLRPSTMTPAATPVAIAPTVAQTEAINALAFRIALIEQRAAAPAPRTASTRELLALLALQEIVERVERGLPFDQVATSLGGLAPPEGAAALGVLALHAPRGVATARGLEEEFARLRPLLESQAVPAETSGLARALGALQGIAADFHLVERPPLPGTALVLARMAGALAAGRLDAVLSEANGLGGTARQMASAWLMAVRARSDVLSAVEQIRRSTWQALARSP